MASIPNSLGDTGPAALVPARPRGAGWTLALPLIGGILLALALWPELLAASAAIIPATLASEDLTCITVGLLIHAGSLNPAAGIIACFLGIFLGDLGLWLIGRWLGRGLVQWPWLQRYLPSTQRERCRDWLDRRGGVAYLAARFLPGTRLPLYLAAGALGQSFGRFALWTGVAALAWTPLLVGSVALLGRVIVEPLTAVLGTAWLVLALAAFILFVSLRLAALASSPIGRARLVARVSRLWRWEFWPTWLFYLPLLPWLAYLSVRYRGMLAWTAANPGILHGGVVGESKHAILAELSPETVVPTNLVPPGEMGVRMRQIRRTLEDPGWSFPLILKPDAGQRGAGVRRARDLVDVEKYLQGHLGAVVVQTYHPGPYEAGVFYFRLPGAERGHIFSITDKVFPVLVGDGRSTVEELVWRHPRYRMQARTFLTRHDAKRGRVLAHGERFVLALAGNHCQGTMFRDGAHLLTPELEQRIDTVARHFRGFFIGRFDIRYQNPAQFKLGQDLAILELNGVTSESTNLYDPSWSLVSAYRTLFRQWSLLYQIGASNRQRGHAATGIGALLRLVFAFYRGRQVDPLAD